MRFFALRINDHNAGPHVRDADGKRDRDNASLGPYRSKLLGTSTVKVGPARTALGPPHHGRQGRKTSEAMVNVSALM